MRTTGISAVLSVALLGAPGLVRAQAAPTDAAPAAPVLVRAEVDSPIRAADARIREALAGLWASPSWAGAMERIRASGGQILVATLPELTGLPERFADEELAETSPLARSDGTVPSAMVVVNLELLERLTARAGGDASELRLDLQRVLIHEIYGHAVPYLLANSLRGRCDDPRPGWLRGCSVDRENVVRSELDLGRRVGYDLSGLWIGSRIGADAQGRR